jgi:hypothetical protein
MRGQKRAVSSQQGIGSLKGKANAGLRIIAFFILYSLIAAQGHAQSTSEPETNTDPRAHLSGESPTQENFFRRLIRAYKQDWSGAEDNSSSPRRIPPAPLTSPPFPSADWNYGGSSVIGATNTTSYPLMQALYSGAGGESWKRSRIQIYGWVNPGFNFSTSRRSNFPAAYNTIPNKVQLDQFVAYVERVPDTVQTDRIDWGFRFGSMYGFDYHFTTAKGWLSQQLLRNNDKSGYDPLMAYVDLYIPGVAKGLNIRMGRYISVPDIEAQLAVNNYTYSHSLLFSYDPFTQTGIIGTLKLNDRWLVNLGVNAGNDIAPWARGAKPSLTACVSYTFRNRNDNIYPCASGINSGKYAYNNVQLLVATWYHKCNASWHMATEAYYEYQRDVPGINSPIPTETNTNPANCPPRQDRCFAPAWATVNYLQKEFSTRNYISIRNEFLKDARGQRTGFPTLYTEHAIMWGHWIGTTVLLRPELRLEHAYNRTAYDNGTKSTQFSFWADLIFRF